MALDILLKMSESHKVNVSLGNYIQIGIIIIIIITTFKNEEISQRLEGEIMNTEFQKQRSRDLSNNQSITDCDYDTSIQTNLRLA